jgi:hypothetical protein
MFLVEQLLFVCCIEVYKKDYLKPMHSLMHGLDSATSFIE